MTAGVDRHFEGRPAAMREAYDLLLEELRAFGPVRESAKQTSIHLEKNAGFAGVHPRKAHFNLEFRTGNAIDDPRVTRELQLSSKRWEHTVRVAAPSDIDAQLVAWLRDAYEQSR